MFLLTQICIELLKKSVLADWRGGGGEYVFTYRKNHMQREFSKAITSKL